MTEERMALIELVEKQADGDLVREMLAFAAERIMEAEIEALRAARAAEAAQLGALMAEVERASGASAERVQEWLTRAVDAPPDPAWVCEGTGAVLAQFGRHLLPF